MAEGRGVRRRDAVIAAGAAAAGVGGTLAARRALENESPLPFYGGPASLLPAPDPDTPIATDLRLVWGAPTSERVVALTFDDGPHPEWTPLVLAALDSAGVPATFFLRGDNVAAHGSLHADSLARHELGNHTYSHTDLARLDLAAAQNEIGRCSEAMATAYGKTPTLFRPPYGHSSGAALLAAAAAGMTTVLWGGRFRESSFHTDPDGLLQDSIGQMRPGTIFLGHDTGTPDRIHSVRILAPLIDKMQSEGWRFVTVSELLGGVGA
ncbi:polysaccharide deacetylase family protein [Nostocoides jenkinsii]|uniref:Polysaccharide deacetylase n=1 Tax=Nostocoides jenkinsii Ben 74 TaxID=1193518 RepID=A0A077M2M3_9MICO|nr:polysaccharide deacetylase family protein [Tetrasphaera jenkinsii]CCI51316.1 Polysaccharide deacetylase [Tetrasphaera jenkinsii Ben 74]